jgi:hypothetical protein
MNTAPRLPDVVYMSSCSPIAPATCIDMLVSLLGRMCCRATTGDPYDNWDVVESTLWEKMSAALVGISRGSRDEPVRFWTVG